MTILDALRSPELFGPWFRGESWCAWKVFLAGLFGLPMVDEAAEIYRRHTGRAALPSTPAREAWLVVGRRGGKSRIAALIAVYLACFREYADKLAQGEVGTLPVIAADRRQARTVMRYIVGFLEGVPMLSQLVANRTKETIELANRVVIEVHTASFRAVRGYSLIGVICDEIAFWPTDEGGANPDTEILTGLRPGMATIPGAMLIAISSPYARRGALWEAYRKHHGQDGDPVLIWQAPTQAMNPAVDPQVIADAYAADQASAAAEYGAEFRRDIESFVSREAVEACIIPDRRELPPVRGVEYVAFVDPSGGSQDSMTLAIAHHNNGHAVLNCVRERKPPFSPDDVVGEFVETLRAYGIERVSGDRYAGEWPRERFRVHDVTYTPSEKPKSDLYRELLPLLTGTKAELLDNPRLIQQLCNLERRTARGGRDSVDHPPGGHDDVINAAAGALVSAADRSHELQYLNPLQPLIEERGENPLMAQIRDRIPHAFEQPPDLGTCRDCQQWKDSGDGKDGKCQLLSQLVYATEKTCDLYTPRADESLPP
jgi:hypothetical protein